MNGEEGAGRTVAEAYRAYLEADGSPEPMVHVLGSLEPRGGALDLAFTGDWDWATGQFVLWSLIYEYNPPNGVTSVNVHVGLPTLGAHTTLPGFRIRYGSPPSNESIWVAYAMNTEGGGTALLLLSPCASVSKDTFMELGYGAFYSADSADAGK